MNPFPNRHARRKALKTMKKPTRTNPPEIDREGATDAEIPQPVAAPQTAPPIASSLEEVPMADATNEPDKEYVFIPGKGHTTSHVTEFLSLIIFRLLGMSPPPKGSLRFCKIPQEYADAMSDEAAKWLREIPAEPTAEEELLAKSAGMTIPSLITRSENPDGAR